MQWEIRHRGEVKRTDGERWQETCDEMVARLGPWEVGKSSVERVNSDFGAVEHDEAAEARIKGIDASLAGQGVTIDRSEQWYATGDRMADSGYATQRAREQKHARLGLVADEAQRLIETVTAERRHDIPVSVGTLGAELELNGKLTFRGYQMKPHAVRGLLARIASPAAGYVFGLRDRLTDSDTTPVGRQADKTMLLAVLKHECHRAKDERMVLRARDGLGDIYATVTPGYGVADAPIVLPELIKDLPVGCKGTASYDAESTAWEVRAEVFTPIPADEQAVGEPFKGFASFWSRDDTGSGLWKGGGIEVLRCLNASVYTTATSQSHRVHRRNILQDIGAFARGASNQIRALCQAWGDARGDIIEVPELVPLEKVIPGFFLHMLTARHGELVGILPGKVKDHAQGLARTFDSERRNPEEIVRADLGNAWTRYVKDQPLPVRQEATTGIARWLVAREPVLYQAS